VNTIDNRTAEWLEADGCGGFASGTIDGIRTRRYHALLLNATNPPTGRMVLVNGIEGWLETPSGKVALTSQRYAPDVVSLNGAERIESFTGDPWPQWIFRLPGGQTIEHGILAVHGRALTVLYWRANPRLDGKLMVRPLISGRDYHALHHENPAFNFNAERTGAHVIFRPYSGVPAIVARSNGSYESQPEWYRNFFYYAENERGLDCIEDLASPGVFSFDLTSEAFLVLAAGDADTDEPPASIREDERARRTEFGSRLHRAADAYVVRRAAGKTIVAGYPWFTDWGRDTFISVRGLCMAGGRPKDAREILLEWSDHVSEGMLPNRFPDAGDSPEYNSVDASLWFIVAADELRRHPAVSLSEADRRRLDDACGKILAGYAAGTRFNIHADSDGLLAAGVPGLQLTWMDAKAGDWVVTPRIGKPVEIEALWINALQIGERIDPRWSDLYRKAVAAFQSRFWNERRRCLYDVIDVDHESGKLDDSIRPNQIFAVGGLPTTVIDDARARAIVDVVETHLVTPAGLRSLAPGEPGYHPHYQGEVNDRDGAYHQGTVWPWLMGPFIEAWIRTHGGDADARTIARSRFFAPMIALLDPAGTGHLPEIADGDPPHKPRGCPFQAWSVGEALRIDTLTR